MRRQVKTSLTYLIAAMIGGVTGWIVKRQEPRVSPASRVQVTAAPLAKEVPPGGEELLDAFLEKTADKKKATKGAGANSFNERFDELSKTLPRSADPGGDFQKLLVEFEAQQAALGKGGNPEKYMDRLVTLGVLLDRWIELDAKAAFESIGKGYGAPGGARIVANTFLDRLTTQYIDKHGLPALMDVLAGTENLVNSTMPAILRDIGKRGSVADLQWLKEKAPAYFSDYQAGVCLGRSWAVDRRDELLAAVDANTAASAISGIVDRMEGSAGGDWVLSQLKGGGFSDDVRKALASSSLGNYYSSLKGATLEQRLEIMKELGTLGKRGETTTKNEMIFNSIRNGLRSGTTDDDLLYSLRHDVMTAREVADAAADKTIDPGKHRGEYNSQMFRTLAEENLPAAIKLLDGMSPAEQERQKALAARWWFRDTNPAEFFQLVESVNSASDGSLPSMLQEAWNDKASGNISRYGAGYLEWIQSLPDGENRNRALISIQKSGNAQLAMEATKLLKKTP